jgi:hypothetical protein
LTAASEAAYQAQLAKFCRTIKDINSTLDFQVSSRGWCYILEEQGLGKGDFEAAQKLINQCRKDGTLPLDICAVDESRTADNLESIDETTPEEEAEEILGYVHHAHSHYRPFSFWDDLNVYVEMAVEKIDLKSLFSPVCDEFNIPICNVKGWTDINGRAAMMQRFAQWESAGKRCVLLYCGDHDPGGLQISSLLPKNLADLEAAVGWSPDQLTVNRFGLNADFIKRHRLTWIDNLETSSGGNLADPRHPDHHKSYVQSYLKQFGARKVEANALIVRPEAGRELCRQAILKYVPASAIAKYENKLKHAQNVVRKEIAKRLATGGRRP